MATTAVNVEGAPILFQVLASALVRHVVDASGAGKKQAEFMGGGGKRVALWPKSPPLLGHHDGDSRAEQCQSHFYVMPAQSPVVQAPFPLWHHPWRKHWGSAPLGRSVSPPVTTASILLHPPDGLWLRELFSLHD